MASDFSFDIVSAVDLQEVDNAVNQALKELRNRFDFKGSKSDLQFNREDGKITFLADDDMKLKSLNQMLKEKLAKRNVSMKALKFGEAEKALDGMLRQTAELIQGIPQDKAKEVVKRIKEMKLKVQASIQSDQIRVSGKNKNDLQDVIHMVKAQEDLNLAFQFVNYR